MNLKNSCELCSHFEAYNKKRHLTEINDVNLLKKGRCELGIELLPDENSPKSGKCEFFEPILV